MLQNSVKTLSLILLFFSLSYAVPSGATTFYFGGAKQTLTNIAIMPAGYYDQTTLSNVETNLTSENIKNGVSIFGTPGNYSGSGGTAYGIPKTGQQPNSPSGAPFATGDDAYLADPAASDVGYPKGTGSWTGYNSYGIKFTNNWDGTVTDNATGLMWVQDSSVGGMQGITWSDALAFCQTSNFAGYTDWRMPNIKELETIVDYGKGTWPPYDPTFDQSINYYWSSTTYLPDPANEAWVVEPTGYGNMVGGYKTNHWNLRPVRGG